MPRLVHGIDAALEGGGGRGRVKGRGGEGGRVKGRGEERMEERMESTGG